jgi:hypothetical protein
MEKTQGPTHNEWRTIRSVNMLLHIVAFGLNLYIYILHPYHIYKLDYTKVLIDRGIIICVHEKCNEWHIWSETYFNTWKI